MRSPGGRGRFLGGLLDFFRLAPRQHQAKRFGIDDCIAAARHAEAPETFEGTVAVIDRQGGEIDGNPEVGPADGPHHRTSRPGIAARQKTGNVAIRIEPEDLRDFFERTSDDIGRLGADGI